MKVLLAALLIAAPYSACVAGAPWGDVEAWVGHYPSDHVGGRSATLFELPTIQNQVSSLLAPEDRRLFASYTLSAEVEKRGHYLLVNRCKVHDCPGGNVTMILDLTSNDIWFAFQTRKARVFTTKWIGTRDYSALPIAVQTEVTSG